MVFTLEGFPRRQCLPGKNFIFLHFDHLFGEIKLIYPHQVFDFFLARVLCSTPCVSSTLFGYACFGQETPNLSARSPHAATRLEPRIFPPPILAAHPLTIGETKDFKLS